MTSHLHGLAKQTGAALTAILFAALGLQAQPNVTVQNVTFPAGQAQPVQVSNTIVTSGTVTVASGGSVTFHAGTRITLSPGFTASNGASFSAFIGIPAGGDSIAPSIPTGLVASGVAPNTFDLSWTASTDNVYVVGYEIRRDTTAIGAVASPNAVISTGVEPGFTYAMIVRAYDASGNFSNWSNPLVVTTLDYIAPSVPAGLVATHVTTSSFRLGWSASTDNATAVTYEVERNGLATELVENAFIDLGGLDSGSQHSLRVRAVDAAGNRSGWSAPFNASTAVDEVAPSVPGNLSTSEVKPTNLTLAWGASSDAIGVTGSEVAVDGTAYATTGHTTMVVAGLAPSTAYQLKVRARDAAGNWSAWSAEIAGSTSAGTVNDGTLSVWEDVNGDGLRDEIFKADSPRFNYSVQQWTTYDPGYIGFQINEFWFLFDLFSSFDNEWRPDIGYGWSASWYLVGGSSYTYTDISLNLETEPGYSYIIKRGDTSGYVNWGSWFEVVALFAENSSFGFTITNLDADVLYDSAFFAAKLSFAPSVISILGGAGGPIPAAVTRTAIGSGTVASVLAAATGAVPVSLNLDGPLVLRPLDLLGALLGGKGRQTIWTVLNAAGVPISLPRGGLLDVLDLGIDLKGRIRIGVQLDDDGYVYWVDVVILPMRKKVADGDISTMPWGGATEHPLGRPIYAGTKNGDMVSWSVDDLLPGNYTWTATGPFFQSAVSVPTVIQGPSGQSQREWRIAREDSMAHSANLDWKPGTYKIKCHVERPWGASFDVEYQQRVGWRTARYMTVGQIRPLDDYTLTSSQKAALRSDLIAHISSTFDYRYVLLPFPDPIADQIIHYANTASLDSLVTLWFAINGLRSVVPPPSVALLPNIGETEKLWMIQNILNINLDEVNLAAGPDDISEPPQDSRLVRLLSDQSYRMLGEYEVKYLIGEDRKMQANSIQSVGETKHRTGPTKLKMPGFISTLESINALWILPVLGLNYSGSNLLISARENPNSGLQRKDIAGGRVSLYTSGRVGDEGSYANYRLVERDVPFIFNEIIFALDADGRDNNNSIPLSVNKTWNANAPESGLIHFNEIRIYQRDNGGPYQFRKSYLIGGGAGMLRPFINHVPLQQWNTPPTTPSVQDTP